MYKLSGETEKNINDTMQSTLGISNEEFKKLDFDKQQELIKEYHMKNQQKQSNNNFVMIGHGEHSCFVNKKLKKLKR